ncbi:MAG: cysteine--tRNA ligase [Clostridia bacterium]|nr:cysteine--tRNA ligase [Clostridia bacterium]
MQFYNTISGKKDEFVTVEAGKVKMYACGPTVYNFFHVGNARCFVVFDMLRRYLEYRGYEVTFVQNFTDIDDKVIKRANEEGVTYDVIAARYIDEYFKDAKGLGVKPATVHPLATDNIEQILDIVRSLVDKGHAYAVDGDVYFRTHTCRGYGKLSGQPIEDLESGARIDINDKKENPLDFALWKAAKPGEPAWESPWGMGRPGWHIECSAMNIRYLGESIDIHCGGQDLIFPHHENEIAQSECCTGKPFARYWLHNGYINIDNRKMSKSLGNFFTVREIAEKYGYLPIRHFILSAHYRSPINFSKEIIEQSAAALERIFNCADSVDFFLKNSPEEALRDGEDALVARFEASRAKMVEAMDDDFNTADGIAALYDLVRDLNSAVNGANPASSAAVKAGKAIFDELTALFGFVKESGGDDAFIAEIEEAIAARTAAKKAKNYAEADRIRAELLSRGVVLEDTAQGTKYKINK